MSKSKAKNSKKPLRSVSAKFKALAKQIGPAPAGLLAGDAPDNPRKSVRVAEKTLVKVRR